MDLTVPEATLTELAAAYLQLTLTLGLAVLCWILYRRYRKPYFGLWALAWVVYALRLGAIGQAEDPDHGVAIRFDGHLLDGRIHAHRPAHAAVRERGLGAEQPDPQRHHPSSRSGRSVGR